jgi:hypothetical protein
MKKILLVIIGISLSFLAKAQTDSTAKDTVWRSGGLFSVNLTQVSLTNWAAGGQNSVSGNSLISLFANYKQGKIAWDNSIDLAYGMVMQGKEGDVLKTDDKIDISSKYGVKAFGNWYYSALLNFKSQFAPGYNYPNDSVAISQFLAPGYLLFALGMDYKPNDYFSLFLSPVTARWLIVSDEILSDAGAFGVDSGETVRQELGAYLKAAFNKDLNHYINLKTSVDMFSDYLNEPDHIDVNFQMLLSLKVSKFISASVSLQALYDHDTKIAVYKSDDITIDHYGPRTQFKEVIGIGFAYKFSNVTVR